MGREHKEMVYILKQKQFHAAVEYFYKVVQTEVPLSQILHTISYCVHQ